ncbi:hypothetical protein PHLCEN_2v10799 [Hermanssonia centrifuga]|uniref:Uncharacterized protein n=1 Tax=Hermanssonia centrifuga TaxID=98765 RepID=A0A2R6NLZ9_9APHY|nr:hypothetical protein PHLCEN_2v10799 [Hermanssonia centrifuga]
METRSRLQQCLSPYLYPSRDQSESPVKSESGPSFAKERLILCVPAGFEFGTCLQKQSSTVCRQWPPWEMHAARPECFKACSQHYHSYHGIKVSPDMALLAVIRFNCWCHGPSLLHEASDAHLVDFHA